MKTRRRIALFSIVVLLLAAGLAAQTPAKDLLKKAKEAFDDEDRDLARELYLKVIELDPEESDAYYRLGVLADDPEEAVAWLKQYAELEPKDAWGWLALGDKLLKIGRTIEAREAYGTAARLAPEAEDIRDGLGRGRSASAIQLVPIGGYAGDSDKIKAWTYGLEGSAPLRGGFRLGARFRRTDLRGAFSRTSMDDYVVTVAGRPRAAMTLSAMAGLAEYGMVKLPNVPPAGQAALNRTGNNGWTTPQGEFRFRWRPAGNGPSADVRLQRLPYATSPQLAFNRAVADDARLIAELPVGPLKVRGQGRISLIETRAEANNRRLETAAILAYPFGWQGEISVQYHVLGFARASTAGYFAPRSVETVEAGTYWELGGEGDWTAEIDLGAGIQRLARQGESSGPWNTALRGWGYFAYDLTPTLQFRIEAEAYSAPFAPVGAVTGENWRYLSLSAGLVARLY